MLFLILSKPGWLGQRLKALTKRLLRNVNAETSSPNTFSFLPRLHRELKLRNYLPEDEELQKRVVPQAKPASVEDKVKDQLEAAKPEPIIEEVDLANLAPRKPDCPFSVSFAGERLRGQEEDLASAVGSATKDGSDSD
uniref:Coiled-coil domain containing 12 n=1 Tax=Sphenodon punctatus TaxID=8508 RepID=A0A8D0HBH0_SPHPU